MIHFVLGSGLGWMAAILTGFEILLPYLLRSAWLRPTDGATGYLTRMWPHYWVGYLLLALSFVHASVLMGGPMVRANTAGITFATLAFCLLCVQVLLGLALQPGRTQNRRIIRRFHFWLMIVLSGSLIVHIWLNG
jgi:hypothetical protein